VSRYRGPSEAQINADALARRDAPYTEASGVSFRVAWDWHNREPENLRDAVRMVRKAYADEVPTRLHEGPDSIGDDGTPKMDARAVGYIFGSEQSSDATRDPETGKPADLISYYHAPFRAALEQLQKRGGEGERHRGNIVAHVTIGSQGPVDAAIAEGVPSWCAKQVAEDAIRGFLRTLTDIKVHLPREDAVA
jgi:hypothetical protein